MLTDAACKKAKPEAKDKKLADSEGLFLLVKPTGSKSWKFKYRFDGKEKKLTIGPYPLISLADARKARDRAKIQLLEGVDPSAHKKQIKAVRILAALDSFERVARAWHEVKSKSLTPRYAAQILDRLVADVFPSIGRFAIRDITPPQILELVRNVEKRGAHEMAHRVRMHASEIFVWAIASGLCEQDPAAVIRKALVPTRGRLRPAATKIKAAQSVLTATEAKKDVYWATRLASRLLALTAARPGVVRLAERSEFEDLEGKAPVWRIPADKMKLTRERKNDASYEFVVPLSQQAVEVVNAALKVSPSPKWLFPGIGDRRKPISDSTLSGHYLDAALRGKHVPHGWRASFSTIMNERAAVQDRERDRAIIDLMLAHVPDGVEAAYNRAAYMPRRRELAQAWADLLMDGLKPATELIPTALR